MNSTKSVCVFLLLVGSISAISDFQNIKNGSRILSRNRRIMDGTLDMIQNHPHVVAVFIPTGPEKYNLCGGTIIFHEWILTAAHCLLGDVEHGVVQSGVNVASMTRINGVVHIIARSIIHEKYDNQTLENDIAMVKIYPPFTWSESCLPVIFDQSNVKTGDWGSLAGYGESGATPHELKNDLTLRSLMSPIISQEACAASCIERQCYYMGPETFCAGFEGTKVYKSICPGDSGSPFVVDGNLIGIASWAEYCRAPKRYPSTYTKVSAYIHWIHHNIGQDILPRGKRHC